MIDEIRAALAAQADPARAASQQAYMKSALPYYGVALPRVRALVRPVVRDHPLPSAAAWRRAVVAMFDGATHREELYAALTLAQHPRYGAWAAEPSALALYEHLVRAGRWWDVCDEVASKLVSPLVLRRREQAGTMLAWSRDDELWVRRVAVQSQLAWKREVDVDLLGRLIEPNLDDPTFWMRKAIGWALREASKHEPEWVRGFVGDHPAMAGLTRREALRRLPA